MSALTVPAGPAKDTGPRPVPWRRTAWVTWRQHRFALGGVALLLGALAVYLWLAGLALHHAYAAAAACRPASSPACQNQMIDFTTSYGSPAQAVSSLLHAVPALIGAFVGAPVLARELETGTFRYAWTLGVGRRRWTLATLVPLAVAVAAAAGVFSLLLSWYLQPFLADGSRIPLDPELFSLRGVAFAAWTLAAFAIGALAGMLIRRVVPAIAVTLAVYAGLAFAAGLYLQQRYAAPLVTSGLSLPGGAWILSQWWTKGGVPVSQSTMDQVIVSVFPRVAPVVHSRAQKLQAVNVSVPQYLTQHGYTQWTRYQPAGRFWPFQWIEGGWLVALSVLLIAGTVWLAARRAA
jgi:ABC-2 family transporter protein